VDRELTPLGEQVGIDHGVVSHELNAQGIQPTGLPYMRCPVCGNVNITLHTKDRTEASCPSCAWHTDGVESAPINSGVSDVLTVHHTDDEGQPVLPEVRTVTGGDITSTKNRQG
jgi:hypothetical protein